MGQCSGPVSLGARAKMHCFRLATAERPQSSLKDTMAFCREKGEITAELACRYILAYQAKYV